MSLKSVDESSACHKVDYRAWFYQFNLKLHGIKSLFKSLVNFYH